MFKYCSHGWNPSPLQPSKFLFEYLQPRQRPAPVMHIFRPVEGRLAMAAYAHEFSWIGGDNMHWNITAQTWHYQHYCYVFRMKESITILIIEHKPGTELTAAKQISPACRNENTLQHRLAEVVLSVESWRDQAEFKLFQLCSNSLWRGQVCLL